MSDYHAITTQADGDYDAESYAARLEDCNALTARQAAEAEAAAHIRGLADTFRAHPTIALLRIARDTATGPTRDLISCVVELLDCSDPADFDGAVDWLHKSVDEYAETYR